MSLKGKVGEGEEKKRQKHDEVRLLRRKERKE